MYESLGIEALTAPQAAVVFGVLIGLAFGILAEVTRFCFRRALVGEDRKQAMGVWLTALAVAVIGTQAAIAADLISFGDHRFMVADIPVLAILIGGALFGAGMVLTRGCVSRLTVLTGSGNLRALVVLVIFAVTAHATLKGVLAPLRTSLGSVTVPMAEAVNLGNLIPGGAALLTAALAVLALVVAARSGNSKRALLGAAALGALVPLGWVGTGFVLYDDFDPIAQQSLSFTAPWADMLFWLVASTAIPAGFGVGLVGGVLSGSLASSLINKRFAWQSFDSPAQTGRYAAGAVMMGVGGVLAGGCTVGAGLAGVPTLSLAAVLALVAIAVGGLAAHALLNPRQSLQNLHPAE